MSAPPINAAACIGIHDIVFITLDTLRYDVAVAALERGETPALAALLPGGAWQCRHSPASFTYAAHHAFFAGFLPTPAAPGIGHTRLFAARFPGSETTGPGTAVFDTPDIVSGLAAHGYHSICIGGTGFFNKQSPLGSVLPSLFAESWWSPELGVADLHSPANQINLAVERIAACAPEQRLFLFINISACHPPHALYLEGAVQDSAASQRAALAAVDAQLPRLFTTLRRRAPLLAILCSDHGTAFGEGGHHGHRIGHPTVWTVPYAELTLPALEGAAP